MKALNKVLPSPRYDVLRSSVCAEILFVTIISFWSLFGFIRTYRNPD